MKTTLQRMVILALVIAGFTLNAQNHALYFDGLNDKIGILDSPELNPNSALTIEAWINVEEWAASIWAGTILSKQATSPDQGYGMTVGEYGRIEFNHSIDEGWVAVNTPQILGLNTWYHIAGVYSGSSMKLYVNGILQSSIDCSGTPTTSEGVVINLGDNPTWTGRLFTGVMDEVRVWEVARTEQEIQENMTIELAGTETGLIAYYPMNEGTGTTIGDASGNNNTGTLLNMEEASWVDGFTPPGNDVGIVGIASPSKIGSGFTSEEWIKVDIKNYATDEISGFDVAYQIDGGDIVTETVTETISAFQTYIYTFSTPVDLASASEIEITAYTILEDDSNPDNDELTETISQSNNFFLFDQEHHNYGGMGQSHTMALYMPEDLSNYSQILIEVDLECPPGGCDPWDQPAKINIFKEAISYEIARYITPYGIACGDWIFDITDFRSLLTGKVEFNSYVQVWGSSGWYVTIELTLVPGTPEYPFVKLTPLWMEDNWVYGDPDISYDFPEQILSINESTDDAKIRMTMSGHGQGNTLNAAEFSNFTHHIWIDGGETFEQHLWKNDCGQNSCSNQGGTWQGSRAGWCPGQDVQPWEWQLTELITPGEDMVIDYILADYTNLQNTGYNGGSHTEPHYRCHAYLLEYSTDEFVSVKENNIAKKDMSFHVYPNPTDGFMEISTNGTAENGQAEITLVNITGNLIDQFEWNGETKTLNFSDVSKGVYFLHIKMDDRLEVKKIVIQ